MRNILLLSAVALGIGGMGSSAQAACNIRGEFCGYPGWAANAFSAPRDRVPEWALEEPTHRFAGERYRKYRGKASRLRDDYRYRYR